MPNKPADESTESSLFDPRYHRLAIAAVLLLFGSIWWVTRDAPAEADVADEVVEHSEPGDVLSGTVVDPAGRPIPEATVIAGDRAVSTDEEGRYGFSVLEPGTHLVDAEAEGFVRGGVGKASLAVAIVEPDAPVDEFGLLLQPASRLTGRVVADGEPVEDADVSVSYLSADGIDAEPLAPYIDADIAESDADGRFTISDVVPGRMKLLVEADEGYAESGEIHLKAGEDRQDIFVDLSPSGEVAGTVVDDRGRAVDADIELTSVFADKPARQTAATEGSFSFDELQEGRYRLRVEADDHHTEVVDDVVVHSDESTELEVRVEPVRGLAGVVVDSQGEPVADANVTVSKNEVRHTTTTTREGRFAWPDLTDGQWEAVANSPRHDPSPPTPLRPGAEIALELTTGGHLSGRVVDESNRPVDAFSIAVEFLEIHGHDRDHTRELPPQQFADARGHFTLGPVPTGRYRLIVEAEDYPKMRTDAVELQAGTTTGPMTIELSSGTELKGRVVDRDTGAPVADARVVHQGSGAENTASRTDSDGNYRLENVPSGLQKLRVEADGYITEIFDGVRVTEGGAMNYDVQLEPAEDGAGGFARYEIGAAFRPVDGALEVLDVESDAPAAEQIESGDRILSIDGRPVEEMEFGVALQWINGDTASPVTLEVERSGFGVRTYDVPRQRVVTPE